MIRLAEHAQQSSGTRNRVSKRERREMKMSKEIVELVKQKNQVRKKIRRERERKKLWKEHDSMTR